MPEGLEGRVEKCESDITGLKHRLDRVDAVVENRHLEGWLEGRTGARRHPQFYFMVRDHVMAMESIKQMIASTMSDEMAKLHSAIDSKLSQASAELSAKVSKVSSEMEALARTNTCDVKGIGDRIDSTVKVIDARIDTLTSKLDASNSVWESTLANKFELFQETARHAVSTADNTVKAQTNDRRFVQVITVVLGTFMISASVYLATDLDKKEDRLDERLAKMEQRVDDKLDKMGQRIERLIVLNESVEGVSKKPTSSRARNKRP